MTGSGGAQASSFCAKGHLTRIKLQKTPRDGAEYWEGDVEEKGTEAIRKLRHHPGPAGEWAAD